MKVYYGSNNNIKLLKEVETESEAFDFVIDNLKERGIKSYYTRWWKDPEGTTTIDYGSCSKFYFIKEN